MLFNSIEYIILLSTSLAIYWLSPTLKIRQLVVLSSSIYFYMSWSKTFAVMLLVMIAINWLIGRKISQNKINTTRARFWLILSCVINLGMLAHFKYMNFFLDNIQNIGQIYDASFQTPILSILLPLGISFYVFELISYQVDVYQGKFSHERSPLVFAIFVLFFPHLIAGPICRAGQFIPQVRILQNFDGAQFYRGLYMFLAGFALKTGIADGIAPYVNIIFDTPANYSGFDNLMATIGFGIQILCDFWGYSLMALGAAYLFGYALPHNFNLPYAATSIRDFWRRWHITLSRWLRDYLYISLGGSRSSTPWKTYRNLALTMLLGGFWHGASWNFIIWGGIHGCALAINRWFDNANAPAFSKILFRTPVISWLLTMSTVFVAWVFFRATSFGDAISMLTQIFSPKQGWHESALSIEFFELVLLFIPLQWLVHATTYRNDIVLFYLWRPVAACTVLAAFSLIYYVDGNEFIYFQF